MRRTSLEKKEIQRMGVMRIVMSTMESVRAEFPKLS